MKHSDPPQHSPKISGMIDDVPRALSLTGFAIIIMLIAALAAGLLLIPSPYDTDQCFGAYIISALF